MTTTKDLPKRIPPAALADPACTCRPTATSENDLDLPLSGLRAVGWARVDYTHGPDDQLLEAAPAERWRL